MNKFNNYLNELGATANEYSGNYIVSGKGFQYDIDKEDNGYALYSYKDRGNKEYVSKYEDLDTIFLKIIIDLEKERYFKKSLFSTAMESRKLFESNDTRQIEESIKKSYQQYVSFGELEPYKICVYNIGNTYTYGFNMQDKFYEEYTSDNYKYILERLFNATKKYQYFKDIFMKLQTIMPLNNEILEELIKGFMKESFEFKDSNKRLH